MDLNPDFDLSEDAQKRFKKKRIGGDANAKGSQYESYFPLAEIVRYAAERWEERTRIFFSDQVDAFVDDLFIEEPRGKHYHQLKSGERATWGDGKIGSIAGDFKCQICREKRNGGDFRLWLVLAEEERYHALSDSVPAMIRSYTKVRHFPCYGSTIALIKENTEFRKHLEGISFGSVNESDLDALVKLIMGCWEGGAKKSIPLSDILNPAQTPLKAWIRSDVVMSISPPLQACLERIEGFDYHVWGERLFWRTEFGDEGSFAYPMSSSEFSTWEKELLANPPQDFESLEPLLTWTAP